MNNRDVIECNDCEAEMQLIVNGDGRLLAWECPKCLWRVPASDFERAVFRYGAKWERERNET